MAETLTNITRIDTRQAANNRLERYGAFRAEVQAGR